MRVLNQLDVPQNPSDNFPFGGIVNESLTSEGTPVIEELYGDIISNCYKILQMTGIVPTGTQDSDITQYQMLEAIQKLPNVINDIEHPFLLTGTVWSVPLKLEFLPNKFVFFGRASEAFETGIAYTLKGTDTDDITYPISCPDGFNANAEVMVVIDQSTVRIYPLNSGGGSSTTDNLVSTALGTPLPFNNFKTMYYLENGKLYSELPTVNDIQATLKTFASDATLLVLQAFVLKGRLVCFTTNSANLYKFYQFDFNDLSTPVLVTYTIPNVTDRLPYCYTDGTYIFITNDANSSANNYLLKKVNYDEVAHTMSNNSSISLEISFYKTTNAVMKSDALITLVSGELISFSLNDGTKTSLGIYDNGIGNLFFFKRNFYFGVGETASKWTL